MNLKFTTNNSCKISSKLVNKHKCSSKSWYLGSTWTSPLRPFKDQFGIENRPILLLYVSEEAFWKGSSFIRFLRNENQVASVFWVFWNYNIKAICMKYFKHFNRGSKSFGFNSALYSNMSTSPVNIYEVKRSRRHLFVAISNNWFGWLSSVTKGFFPWIFFVFDLEYIYSNCWHDYITGRIQLVYFWRPIRSWWDRSRHTEAPCIATPLCI